MEQLHAAEPNKYYLIEHQLTLCQCIIGLLLTPSMVNVFPVPV